MNSKIKLKEQIDLVLSNVEMTEEIRILLISIKEDLSEDLDEKQKWQLYLKWLSLFKNTAEILLIAQKFLE